MSVTFAHTAEPIISGWFFECGCGGWQSSEEYADRNDAVAVLTAGVTNGCSDEYHQVDPVFISPRYVGIEPLSANFSNTNARHLLLSLGIHNEDLFGSMSVEEFERALARFEVTDGTPDRVTVTVGGESVTVEGGEGIHGARYVECGRDAGYDVRALRELKAIATQARELHASEIYWG